MMGGSRVGSAIATLASVALMTSLAAVATAAALGDTESVKFSFSTNARSQFQVPSGSGSNYGPHSVGIVLVT